MEVFISLDPESIGIWWLLSELLLGIPLSWGYILSQMQTFPQGVIAYGWLMQCYRGQVPFQGRQP